jgi:hypothetical protein
MKNTAAFRSFFDTELRPTLVEIEKRRLKIMQRLIIMFGVVLITALAVLGLVAPARSTGGLIACLIAGGLLCALGWWLIVGDYVKVFKQQIIAKIVRYCSEDLDYYPERRITETQFKSSQIFNHHIDRYRGEDLVKGTIEKTAVQFSEVHAEYKTETTDSKGNRQTHWHTIFKGLFFIGDFNKHFKGRTAVLPDTAEKLFGFLGQKLQAMNFGRDQLVKMEDPEFEKEFVVYGTDQIEARYILSTALMRRILDFKNKTGTKIYLSFVASNVHVAIPSNRNMFEPRIFQTVLDFKLAQEYLNDLEFAMGIVDELNLNTRIWTKE